MKKVNIYICKDLNREYIYKYIYLIGSREQQQKQKTKKIFSKYTQTQTHQLIEKQMPSLNQTQVYHNEIPKQLNL